MAIHAFVNISIPEATKLADLTGISNDFDSAREFALQLKGMLDQTPPDYSLIDLMTTAILVRYYRPFGKGIRRWARKTDEVNALSSTQRSAHDLFLDWRSKHIAHSVNPFEENQPVAHYCVERLNSEGFTSISCKSDRVIGLSLDDVEMIIQLTAHFIERLRPQVELEKAKVLEVVRLMSPADILAGKKPRKRANVSRDAGKGREQHH